MTGEKSRMMGRPEKPMHTEPIQWMNMWKNAQLHSIWPIPKSMLQDQGRWIIILGQGTTFLSAFQIVSS